MKKGLVIILIAIMLAGGAAYYLFNNIVVKDDISRKSSCNAFQVGAFTNYDNALKVAQRDNGIVIKDDDIYRVYVAILSDREAVNKLREYYDMIGLNYYLKKIYVDDSFVDEIKNNEELLKVSSSDTYATINLDVLKKYEEML